MIHHKLFIKRSKQFGREMNQGVDENWKLFWKEVSKVNREKVEVEWES